MNEQQQHPIENLMQTTMENMKDMIDVNTIVGDPVETTNGQTIIPISKVTFGFASGGGEYSRGTRREGRDRSDRGEESQGLQPFAGGSGAGITVQPVAFMVVGKEETKLMSVDQNINMIDNILSMTPKLMENMQNMFSKVGRSSKENKSNRENRSDREHSEDDEDDKRH